MNVVAPAAATAADSAGADKAQTDYLCCRQNVVSDAIQIYTETNTDSVKCKAPQTTSTNFS